LTRQNIPNYTDDSYYWPQADTTVSAMRVYDRNMREFIFLEDTVQYPDTVRMLIVEK
jgi:acetone carboxylase gamma subunit